MWQILQLPNTFGQLYSNIPRCHRSLTGLIGHGGPGQIHGVESDERRLQQARPRLGLLHRHTDNRLSPGSIHRQQAVTWFYTQKTGCHPLLHITISISHLDLREDGDHGGADTQQHVDADEDLVLRAASRVGVVYIEQHQGHQRDHVVHRRGGQQCCSGVKVQTMIWFLVLVFTFPTATVSTINPLYQMILTATPLFFKLRCAALFLF